MARRKQRTTSLLAFCLVAASCRGFGVPNRSGEHAPRRKETTTVALSSTALRSSEQVTLPVLDSKPQQRCSSSRTSDDDAANQSSSETALREHLDAGRVGQAASLLRRTPASTTAEYNLVLTEYARQGRVAEAEALLQHMLTIMADRSDCCCQPDRHSYYQLLDALLVQQQQSSGAKSHNSNEKKQKVAAARRAQEILASVIAQYGSASPVVYNKVLKLWKQSQSPEASPRAHALLQDMIRLQIADRISYTTYIGILASSSSSVAGGGGDAAARAAQEMAQEMMRLDDPNLHPNTQTWNTVISGWVRCGRLDEAEQVLRRMEEGDEYPAAPPNVVSYSTLIDGWAKSRRSDAISRMEALLKRMQQPSSTSPSNNNDNNCRPNFWTYVTLIHAYARQRDTASAQKAQDLVFEMYDESQNRPELKPNTQLVTAVMDAWQCSSADGAPKAEKLLDWMIEVGGGEQGDPDLAPNEYSVSSAISAWGRSRSMGKAIHARQILNRMVELHDSGHLTTARPNTICYTAVINCCAYSQTGDEIDQRAALRIAITTFKELEQSPHASPNEVTYATLLTALRNLLPSRSAQRNAAVRDVFQSAAAKGYADPLVVQRLKSALPREEISSVLPAELLVAAQQQDGGLVRIDQIPSEWCRNVRVR